MTYDESKTTTGKGGKKEYYHIGVIVKTLESAKTIETFDSFFQKVEKITGWKRIQAMKNLIANKGDLMVSDLQKIADPK